MGSNTTTSVGVRLENELLAKLDALAALRHESRTATAREALRLGLQQLQAAHAIPAKTEPRAKRTRAAAAPVQTPAAAPDLKTFAGQVLEAARKVPKRGRFGDDRVFVSHLWRRFQKDHRASGLDLDSFKARLLEANRARLLSLARADMAPDLDQTDVSESLINYLSATFHFVSL